MIKSNYRTGWMELFLSIEDHMNHRMNHNLK
jgi:hypothetical protein